MTVRSTRDAGTGRSSISGLLRRSAVDLPLAHAAQVRNIALDRLFYDVGALTATELDFLVEETNLEGSILVVHPGGAAGDNGIRKHRDLASFTAAPGEMVTRFAVAGLGSSDVGAAALARNAADYYNEPVAAIVAGFDVADMLAETAGGWLVLGAGSRLTKLVHDVETEAEALLTRFPWPAAAGPDSSAGTAEQPDGGTLVRLLLDDRRQIKTILAHSKGCLSVARAFEVLAERTDADAARERAKQIRIVTAGAVVAFPPGVEKIAQFLGALDWLGAMNSDLSRRFTRIPGAAHHVNAALPGSLRIRDVLARADALMPRPPRRIDLSSLAAKPAATRSAPKAVAAQPTAKTKRVRRRAARPRVTSRA